MNFPISSQALIYEKYGKPLEVLQLGERSIEKLESDEVLLKILAAPINPADMGKLMGSYGSLETLPAVGGLEGVAEVAAVGDACSKWKVGDRVLAPNGCGSWQTYATAKESAIFKSPQNCPIEQAAMAWVNPATAWKMLADFVDLKEGDWIIQNAATSGVGKLVIQIAKAKGVKTINLVRDIQVSDHLKSLGADIVIVDDKDAAKAILAETGGVKAKLALNAVGGVSSYGMMKVLADGACHVTYGGMDRALSPFPTRYLIFNDIQLRGFWVSKFYKKASRETIEALQDELYPFLEKHKIVVDIEKAFPLSDFEAAIKQANAAGKKGKVLFQP